MNVIPVEVKKGKKVDAISLNNFKKTYNCPFAYRMSASCRSSCWVLSCLAP